MYNFKKRFLKITLIQKKSKGIYVFLYLRILSIEILKNIFWISKLDIQNDWAFERNIKNIT